jgi:hypothetical protein
MDHKIRRERGECPRKTHVDDRGTTIDVSLSYFEFQSLTRVLESDQLNYVNDEEAAYFGTATRRVSRYSES